MTTFEDNETSVEVQNERELARKRVQARRDFSAHVVTYVVVNAFLILIWAVTGAGYFWPIWVIGGWGVGLALHAWDTFLRRPVTEADVDAELTRHHK
jgi:hypothetical protein